MTLHPSLQSFRCSIIGIVDMLWRIWGTPNVKFRFSTGLRGGDYECEVRIKIGANANRSDASFELCLSSVSCRLTPVRFGSQDEFVEVI